jgi:hypothetical protein
MVLEQVEAGIVLFQARQRVVDFHLLVDGAELSLEFRVGMYISTYLTNRIDRRETGKPFEEFGSSPLDVGVENVEANLLGDTSMKVAVDIQENLVGRVGEGVPAKELCLLVETSRAARVDVPVGIDGDVVSSGSIAPVFGLIGKIVPRLFPNLGTGTADGSDQIRHHGDATKVRQKVLNPLAGIPEDTVDAELDVVMAAGSGNPVDLFGGDPAGVLFVVTESEDIQPESAKLAELDIGCFRRLCPEAGSNNLEWLMDGGSTGRAHDRHELINIEEGIAAGKGEPNDRRLGGKGEDDRNDVFWACSAGPDDFSGMTAEIAFERTGMVVNKSYGSGIHPDLPERQRRTSSA